MDGSLYVNPSPMSREYPSIVDCSQTTIGHSHNIWLSIVVETLRTGEISVSLATLWVQAIARLRGGRFCATQYAQQQAQQCHSNNSNPLAHIVLLACGSVWKP